MWAGLILHVWSYTHHLVMVCQGYLSPGSQRTDAGSVGQGLPSMCRQA